MVIASESEISVNLYGRGQLLEPAPIGALQDVLRTRAPDWSGRLRFVLDESRHEYSEPIDISRPGMLFEAIKREIARPPSHFMKELEAKFGPPGPWRVHHLQLIGQTSAMMLFLEFGDRGIRPLGDRWYFGNSIGLGTSGGPVEGHDAGHWITAFVSEMVAAVEFDYGYASTAGEYRKRNMSTEGGGLRTLGHSIPCQVRSEHGLPLRALPVQRCPASVRRAHRQYDAQLLVVSNEGPGDL